MAEAHEAPQGGALSIDEAVALLDRREDEDDGPDAAAFDYRVVARDAGPSEDDAEGAETPDDEDDDAEAGEDGGADRLAAPAYWSQDAKARFAELDPDLQAVVLSQEGPREEAAAHAKAEAEAVRQGAVEHASQALQLAEVLAQALPEAFERFHDRWRGAPDWSEIAEIHGVEAANQLHAQFTAEQASLARAHAAAQAADQVAHRAYVAREAQILRRSDPDLIDPVRGDQLRGEISHYLVGRGVDAAQLTHISALEISLARKAMLWDRAQARARTSAAHPRPGPPAVRPLTRGGASSGPVDPQARRAAQAKTRFAKTRSIDDAVALLNTQGD
jgi:hypothetical protein